MLSNRQLKIGETIKRSLSLILAREIYIDALGESYIPLSKVIMTPDLGIADVYMLPLINNKLSDAQVLEILNRMSAKIRHVLAQKVVLKKLPVLRFRLDNSLADAAKMERLLKR
jgi:ribosome-binding factor A